MYAIVNIHGTQNINGCAREILNRIIKSFLWIITQRLSFHFLIKAKTPKVKTNLAWNRKFSLTFLLRERVTELLKLDLKRGCHPMSTPTVQTCPK